MPVEAPFKLSPESQAYKDIQREFLEDLRRSRAVHSLRVTAWAKNEDTQKAYVPVSELDAKRNTEREQNGKPNYTTIEIPFSYAQMLTIHTYLTSVFLSRTPILQVSGRHGESQNAETSMESLLDYQMTTGGNLPPLFIWLLDPLRYGHGVIGQFWDSEQIAITTQQPQAREFEGQPIPGTEEMTTLQDVVQGYEGIKLFNVRPQDFLHDADVPIGRFQEGRYCIQFSRLSWATVEEREEQGLYFNIEKARQLGITAAGERDLGSPRTNLPGNDLHESLRPKDGQGNPTILNIHEFYYKIIPSKFGLGPGKRRETWVFTIANESTIIGAQPLGLLHNKFPFDVIEYEFGGYEMFNRSVLEVTSTLNDTMSWLFNSHFFNVRKAVNDQFFVDPSMIEMSDLTDKNPGRLVRLKPAAYGKPVDGFVKQFPVTDITRNNLQDSNGIADLMQRLVGSSDALQGVSPGGRQTATESRITTGNAANKLQTTGEWWSATGFAPMTQKMLQTTQQLYDGEKQFRIVGDVSRWGKAFIPVTPESIAGYYDFVPVDGTIPIDRFAQANLWQQLLQGMVVMPEVMQQFDVAKIFAFVAQLSGLKNVDKFRVQVVPDEQAIQNAQSGNSIPITEGNPVEPQQIRGLGPTG